MQTRAILRPGPPSEKREYLAFPGKGDQVFSVKGLKSVSLS
jgi:hypothetical protein